MWNDVYEQQVPNTYNNTEIYSVYAHKHSLFLSLELSLNIFIPSFTPDSFWILKLVDFDEAGFG